LALQEWETWRSAKFKEGSDGAKMGPEGDKTLKQPGRKEIISWV
jgi:hypothetical protein